MKGKRLFLLFFAIVALSSCQALFFEDRAGQPIRFNASMRSNSLTKTMYAGGQTYDTDEGKKERINWTQDDDVSVYLYWELQNGSAPAKADPDAKHGLDYNVTPTRNVNERGYGTLAAKAEKLTWKGSAKENVWFDHYFYSTYPASLSNKYSSLDYQNPQDVEITFNLPAANANDMKYAYMAAAAQSVSTREDENYTQSVDLDYYPMITTLYVTLINESNKTGNLNVKVSPSASNTKNPLFGSYSAKLNAAGNRFITTDTKEANVTADYSSYNYYFEGKGPKSVPFFIRPRNYAANDVTLTIGDKAYDLDYAFVPCHKYNITVTVKDGDIVTPPMIDDDALAQMILAFTRAFDGGEKFYNAFKDFVDNNFDSYDDYLSFWNNFTKQDIETVKGAAERLKTIFDDKYEAFLEALGEIEDITIKTYGTKADNLTFGDTFNSIFKKVKKVRLILNNDVTIKIEGSTTLESFEVTDDSNAKIDLEIKDCPEFKYFEIGNNAQLTSLKMIRTPHFLMGLVKNSNNPSSMSIQLEDCSTDIDGYAYIRFFNQNLRPSVTRTKDTKNVVVECGYYDVINWYPLEYGDWHSTWKDQI